MASEKQDQTVADYVAVAVCPALIMGLVGSLVFFLLEVCYSAEGEYKEKLQWILFFFVLGAVLAARISLTAGIAGRAGAYGFVLAVLTWFGMQAFVEYPKDNPVSLFSWLINAVLVGLTWWCSHRLTRDCTNIDEETEIGGEGLLQATGLEKAGEGVGKEPETEPEPEKKERRPPGALVRWWERWQRWQGERDKKRRVLGAWVIYFSLAALPIFGLGQALIPVEDAGRRAFAFWLMAIYVGSGLGLLLTTCFLSLRRYLRQRKLQMPAAMTLTWLALGGGLTLALLVVGALLPRPQAEYALFPFQPVGGQQRRDASQFAPGGGDPGKGPGDPGGRAPRDKSGDDGVDKGKGGDGVEKDKEGPTKDKSGPAENKDKTAGSKDKGNASGKEKGGDGEKGKGGEDQPSQNRPPRQPQDAERPRDDKSPAERDERPKSGQSPTSGNTNAAPKQNTSWTSWTGPLQGVAEVVKWIVFIVMALVVLFLAFRHGLKFLANFTDWAKRLLDALNNFWANLFARRKAADGAVGEGEEGVRKAAERPFASFANPFLDSRAARLSPKDLVRYSFAALQAWARERGLARAPGETPLEFAARVGQDHPALEADVRRLANLYARAVYDYGPLPANAVEAVKRFWQRLGQAVEQPLSM
jgi:hypothetical protein